MTRINLSEGKNSQEKTVAEMFAEALGNIENAIHYLQRVNEQCDPEQCADQRLTFAATDFWLQAELAEDALKGILHRLQRVEPLAPKEVA